MILLSAKTLDSRDPHDVLPGDPLAPIQTVSLGLLN